jgi:hypothetical protein
VIVPMEKVLRTYLNTQGLGVKVAGENPKDTEQAWVKITQLDDRAVGVPDADYFHNHHVQLDCYASVNGTAGQDEARELYLATRAALVAMKDVDLDDAVVTAVRFGACPRVPDEAFNPARQRYVIDAHIYAHVHS